MDNFSEQDVERLKLMAKKYFELEKSIDPLMEDLDKIKLIKKKKEKEIKDRNEALESVKSQILSLLEKNQIDALQTNKGKFKIHNPPPKTIKYKQKEVRENITKFLSEHLKTTDEQNKELYEKFYNKEKVERPTQLRIYKRKPLSNEFNL